LILRNARYGLEGLVVVVAGNKTDLASSTRRAVTELEGRYNLSNIIFLLFTATTS
jgi:hypothetical protein